MPLKYHVRKLPPDGTVRAFPVIQAAWPDVSLDSWVAYVEKLCTPSRVATGSSGIMAAENPRGYIHGLFCYIVHVALNHGSVLVVDNFVALDAGDRAAAVEALLAAMEALARDLRCTAIHTHIPHSWANRYGDGIGIMDHLQNSGHDPAFVKFCKAIGDKRTLQ